ncbi:hemerythrin domain-containing protein [Ottowia sp.]|uniref:hemerythrin domain-containing protein n=1 Tax=Ottowia sp. TaxID=1898956 RepID=UPI003A8BBE79
MPRTPPVATDVAAGQNAIQQPLNQFSNCHEGILRHLDGFGELPALLAPVQRARAIAEDMVRFFRQAVFEHHAEEERELFPAVLKSAQPGDEKTRVQQLIDQLTREHRDVEKQWALLEPALKKLAKGQPAELDGAAIGKLVAQYQAHARFEEAEFLPLSHDILDRNSNHMAALGLSLHIRHLKPTVGHVVRGSP